MKVSLVLLVGCISLSACRGEAPQGFSYATLYLLPDGRYEVAGVTSDLPKAMQRLPASTGTRINVAACSTSRSTKVIETVRALEAAGYERIGFITTDTRNQPACGR